MSQFEIDMMILRLRVLMAEEESMAILKHFERFIVDCQESTDPLVKANATIINSKFGLDQTWPEGVENQIILCVQEELTIDRPTLTLVKGGKSD